MKLKYILPIAALLFGTIFTSCVKNLEVENINPQQTSDFNEDYIFNKIYGNLVLTGQTGPSGNQDLDDIDEGTSNMIRQLWNANELTTDEAHCIWNDPGIPEFNHNSWSNTHPMMKALYYRLMFGVTLCNFYLDNANNGDAETKQKRAEARFMRALHYFYLMDLYANPPYLTAMSTDNAPQIRRADLFNFLESELKAILGEGSSDEVLANPKTIQYGRADKAAAYMLLARMYLNAGVYTATPRWADAKTYADKAIESAYSLCTEAKNGYSPFQLLFMGDNDQNGAQNEIILPALHDGDKTQTWGGSLYLIAAMGDSKVAAADLYGHKKADGKPLTGYGTSENWGGIRARKQFVQAFFSGATTDAAVPQGTLKDVVKGAGDDRALFYTKGHTLSITDESNYEQGFVYLKFNNIHADGTASHHPGNQYVDTNFPMMRLAEAYLTAAEAEARMNNGICAPAAFDKYIKPLHNRANIQAKNPLSKMTEFKLEDIIKEWSREFGFEGQRRMHLIRFKMYGGQSAYRWEWMGGAKNGTPFDSRFNIFPIPDSELNANPNMKPNY